MNNVDRDIQRKLRALRHAEQIGDVSKTCRYFGIGRAKFLSLESSFPAPGGSWPDEAQTRAEEPRQPDASGDRREGPDICGGLTTWDPFGSSGICRAIGLPAKSGPVLMLVHSRLRRQGRRAT